MIDSGAEEGGVKTPSSLPDEIERLYVHEAAHATVALALGVRVKRIVVTPKGGTVEWDPTPHTLVINLAGLVGEALLYGEAEYPADGGGDTTVVSELPIERQDALTRRAAEILSANRETWVRIAGAIRSDAA